MRPSPHHPLVPVSVSRRSAAGGCAHAQHTRSKDTASAFAWLFEHPSGRRARTMHGSSAAGTPQAAEAPASAPGSQWAIGRDEDCALDGRCRPACRASVAPLNFVSDFPIKSAFLPKNFSSPAAGSKGLRLACGGFATLARTITPVSSRVGVTSQGAPGPPTQFNPPVAAHSLGIG